jgi:hypothetical protein
MPSGWRPRHRPKLLDGPRPVPIRHQAPQPLQVPLKLLRIEPVVLHHQNLVMLRGQQLLLLLHQLFAEPLPRPQADDLDGDVLTRLQAGEPDQVLGQVQDVELGASNRGPKTFSPGVPTSRGR